MNQTQKRLSIINLAISITDFETIQLQILKLGMLKPDERVKEIIAMLRSENYAKSQKLINIYIGMSSDNVLKNSINDDTLLEFTEDKETIDKFDFLLSPEATSVKEESRPVDFSSLLDIDSDEVLTKEKTKTISKIGESTDTIKDTTLEVLNDFSDDEINLMIDTHTVPKDTFFDNEDKKHPVSYRNESFITNEAKSDSYEPIPEINNYFSTLKAEYPLRLISDKTFMSVDDLLLKISKDRYTEEEIKEQISSLQELSKKSKTTEAALLLLICSVTESKFAQLILARELYRGVLFKKNIKQSFTLIESLAMYEYPEALCDLGQFYENGIGIEADIVKAEEYYRQSMGLGIKRASKHYTRVSKKNSRLFGKK